MLSVVAGRRSYSVLYQAQHLRTKAHLSDRALLGRSLPSRASWLVLCGAGAAQHLLCWLLLPNGYLKPFMRVYRHDCVFWL